MENTARMSMPPTMQPEAGPETREHYENQGKVTQMGAYAHLDRKSISMVANLLERLGGGARYI